MSYTPGYSENAVRFMQRRSLKSHGAFILPYLRDRQTILDLGCGPGTITVDIARLNQNGRVVAVDRESSQIEAAKTLAAARGIENIEFQIHDVTQIAPVEGSFDLIFSHALFEHLSEPITILREIRPRLSREGVIALRCPDWGGMILHPDTGLIQAVVRRYEEIQQSYGGDTRAGRKLHAWLSKAGYSVQQVSATCEVYPSSREIARYLALQLTREGEAQHASNLLNWASHPESLFSQLWFEVIAKPI